MIDINTKDIKMKIQPTIYCDVNTNNKILQNLHHSGINLNSSAPQSDGNIFLITDKYHNKDAINYAGTIYLVEEKNLHIVRHIHKSQCPTMIICSENDKIITKILNRIRDKATLNHLQIIYDSMQNNPNFGHYVNRFINQINW